MVFVSKININENLPQFFCEANIVFVNRDHKEVSKQWIKPGENAPKRSKTAGKVMVSVFWDAHGVISIGYLEKGRTITGAYYVALLDRWVDEIRKKQPHLKKKIILFHDENAPSHTLNIAQAKNRTLQTWLPATIIYSHTSRDGCVVGVLSRTKKLNGKQKGILWGLINRIIWKE